MHFKWKSKWWRPLTDGNWCSFDSNALRDFLMEISIIDGSKWVERNLAPTDNFNLFLWKNISRLMRACISISNCIAPSTAICWIFSPTPKKEEIVKSFCFSRFQKKRSQRKTSARNFSYFEKNVSFAFPTDPHPTFRLWQGEKEWKGKNVAQAKRRSSKNVNECWWSNPFFRLLLLLTTQRVNVFASFHAHASVHGRSSVAVWCVCSGKCGSIKRLRRQKCYTKTFAWVSRNENEFLPLFLASYFSP